MTATAVELSQAVVDSLNGTAFSQAFTAERAWVPRKTLAELTTSLCVTVVPKTIEVANSRGTLPHEIGLTLGVQRKLIEIEPAKVLAEIDGLVAVTEEIFRWLFQHRPAALESAVATVAKTDPLYAWQDIDQNRVFFSLLTLTYVLRR